MKFRFCAYVIMMMGLTLLVAACGGGGGGGGGTVITVTAAKNPVLNNTPVTVTADFINYTSTARFGASRAQVGLPVTFTVSPAATLSNQTTIQADYTATVDVTATLGANVLINIYTVNASLNSAAGNTAITFITQPASVGIVVVPKLAYTGVGVMQYDITNDSPVLFRKYSTAKGPTLFSVSNPVPSVPPSTLPANRVTVLLADSTTPFNLAPTSTLFKLSYNVSAGIPLFAVDSDPLTQVAAYYVGVTDITPSPVLLITPTYFSGPNETGTKLYPLP